MKTLNVVLVCFLGLISTALFSPSSAEAQSLCKVAIKSSPLARDQRDDARMKCLKTVAKKIETSTCLKIANSMEYSNNAEDARLVCLYDIKKQDRLSQCLSIANSMEYPDSGDEVRWECIRRHTKTILKKECLALAQKMSYPGNTQRAQVFCTQELPRK